MTTSEAPPLDAAASGEEPTAVATAGRMATLEAKLAGLPASSGCYLFLGARSASGEAEVLYVGKAKALRLKKNWLVSAVASMFWRLIW